ncbi:C6 transcription factor [Penicillium riverlandense]|uniref:C6 transcription factor n=1 Tax=Penicillium riverlandense TaxID=1903569 RepID=UPI0025473626|nr:C6 transcription factor [Penicillium riverlandense]KAJ5815546.1 C6 transcription factor [Penicillium riverlandense]
MCVRSGNECQARAPIIPRRAHHKRKQQFPALVDARTISKGSAVENNPTFHAQDVPAITRQCRTGSSQNNDAVPTDPQRFGANSSAVGFASRLFGDQNGSPSDHFTSIPGHIPDSTMHETSWTLRSLQRLPPLAVLTVLFDAYFDQVHWFIFIFYEPSFRQESLEILSRATWNKTHVGKIQVALMVAAVGLYSVKDDANWPGHQILSAASIDPEDLLNNLINEARSSFVDLLDECSIETVQVCILLGTYYIYNGSPTLAWSIIGQAVRTAYALTLYCDDSNEDDNVVTQIRHRIWAHVLVADTFAAMVYGRPLSLDPAFSQLLPLRDLDDTKIPGSFGDHPSFIGQRTPLTQLSFARLKHRLYDLIRLALNKFRLLFSQTTVPLESASSLICFVKEANQSLETWRADLPPLFDWELWPANGPAAMLPSEMTLSESERKHRRHLILQAVTLQISYDCAVIFINRPILEYRSHLESHPELASSSSQAVARSFHAAADAAIRISKTPMAATAKGFNACFLLMNYFTAGVILCVIPTVIPYSALSNEAKNALLRIIHSSRVLKRSNRIAKHTEELLSTLMRLSLQQEMESALRQDNGVVPRESFAEISMPSHGTQSCPPPHPGHYPELFSSISQRPDMSSILEDGPAAEQSSFEATEFENPLPGYNEENESFDNHLDDILGTFGQGELPSHVTITVSG